MISLKISLLLVFCFASTNCILSSEEETFVPKNPSDLSKDTKIHFETLINSSALSIVINGVPKKQLQTGENSVHAKGSVLEGERHMDDSLDEVEDLLEEEELGQRTSVP